MSAKAKLFTHGRSQAVLLPEDHGLPGTEVRVTRAGHNIVSDPIKPSPIDREGWWRAIGRLGAANFVIERRAV